MSVKVKEGAADPAGSGSADPTKETHPGDGSNPKTTQEGAGGEGEGDSQFDIEKLDPRAKKLISDLRRENGDHRVKNKALTESHSKLKKSLVEAGIIEDDEEKPEEKLKQVTSGLQGATLKNAILEAAIENGVGKEGYKYFQYLVQDKLSSLEDDAELTEDDLAELALEARGRAGGASGTTSVGDSKDKPNPKGSGEVTLDQFTNMNITEKTVLFKSNPDLYNRLFAEAKSKKLHIR